MDRGRSTARHPARAWEKHLAEPMKGLRVRDVRVSTADGILRAIIGKHGRAQSVHAKVVLTGIFALAVRHDARESNPVRELAPARPAKAQPKIELTEVSVAGLLAVLGGSEYAARHDLPHLVFPSSTGTIKDPNNTRTALRKVLEGTEWAELHPHAFRHLVADRLDAAGLTARQIADYLGHSNISTTQEVYLTRKAVGGSADRNRSEKHG